MIDPVHSNGFWAVVGSLDFQREVERLMEVLFPQMRLHCSVTRIQDAGEDFELPDGTILLIEKSLADGSAWDFLQGRRLGNVPVILACRQKPNWLKAVRFSVAAQICLPLDAGKFYQAILKADEIRRSSIGALYSEFLRERMGLVLSFVAVPLCRETSMVRTFDILRIEKLPIGSMLVLLGKPNRMSTRSLKGYYRLLHDQGFVRSEDGALVNTQHFRKRLDSGEWLMSDGSRVFPLGGDRLTLGGA